MEKDFKVNGAIMEYDIANPSIPGRLLNQVLEEALERQYQPWPEDFDYDHIEDIIGHAYRMLNLPAPEVIWADSPIDCWEQMIDRFENQGPYQRLTINVDLFKWVLGLALTAAQGVVHEVALHRIVHRAQRMIDDKAPAMLGIIDTINSGFRNMNRTYGNLNYLNATSFVANQSTDMALLDVMLNHFDLDIRPFNHVLTCIMGHCTMYDCCILIRKPVFMKYARQRQGWRLHCENGPAVHFFDDTDFYFLNGVEVDEHIVTTPAEKLDAAQIFEELNVERRRELVRKIGIKRVCEKLGAQTIDSQGDYELLLLDIKDGLMRPYLKMKNPSLGLYHVEGVPPEIRTVAEALAWRNGTGEEPVVIS